MVAVSGGSGGARPVRARTCATRSWWTAVLQLVKTVVAAVVAWVLASQVFALPQAFLAPWAALLVVHATVYRTFSRGLRQVTGAVLGRAAGLGRRQLRSG